MADKTPAEALLNNTLSKIVENLFSGDLTVSIKDTQVDSFAKQAMAQIVASNVVSASAKELDKTIKELVKELKSKKKLTGKTFMHTVTSQMNTKMVESLSGQSKFFDVKAIEEYSKALQKLSKTIEKITKTIQKAGDKLDSVLKGKGSSGGGGNKGGGIADSIKWIFSKNNNVGTIVKGITSGIGTLIGFLSGRGFFKKLTGAMFDALAEAQMVKRGLTDLIRLGALLIGNWVKTHLTNFLSLFMSKKKAEQYAGYAGGAVFLGGLALLGTSFGRKILGKVLGKAGPFLNKLTVWGLRGIEKIAGKSVPFLSKFANFLEGKKGIQTLSKSKALTSLKAGEFFKDEATGKYKKVVEGAAKKDGTKSLRTVTVKESTALGQKTAQQAAQKTAQQAAQKTTQQVTQKVTQKTTQKILQKAGSKALLKKIPLVGLGFGAMYARDRWKAGDKLGAMGEIASGAASIIPGYGTAISTAIDVGLMGRDIYASKHKGSTKGFDKRLKKHAPYALGATGIALGTAAVLSKTAADQRRDQTQVPEDLAPVFSKATGGLTTPSTSKAAGSSKSFTDIGKNIELIRRDVKTIAKFVTKDGKISSSGGGKLKTASKLVAGKIPSSSELTNMNSLGLKGKVAAGNSDPRVPKKYAENVKNLDKKLSKWGFEVQYTSNMGGGGVHKGGSRSHAAGEKVDVQLFKNGKPAYLSKEEEAELRKEGYIGHGAFGWEARKGQVGGGHYDFHTGRYVKSSGSVPEIANKPKNESTIAEKEKKDKAAGYQSPAKKQTVADASAFTSPAKSSPGTQSSASSATGNKEFDNNTVRGKTLAVAFSGVG